MIGFLNALKQCLLPFAQWCCFSADASLHSSGSYHCGFDFIFCLHRALISTRSKILGPSKVFLGYEQSPAHVHGLLGLQKYAGGFQTPHRHFSPQIFVFRVLTILLFGPSDITTTGSLCKAFGKCISSLSKISVRQKKTSPVSGVFHKSCQMGHIVTVFQEWDILYCFKPIWLPQWLLAAGVH